MQPSEDFQELEDGWDENDGYSGFISVHAISQKMLPINYR